MSLKLTIYGDILFGDYFKRVKPIFNGFVIQQDGHSHFTVGCPGKGIKQPIATFTGTYAQASKALKLQLITSRLTK